MKCNNNTHVCLFQYTIRSVMQFLCCCCIRLFYVTMQIADNSKCGPLVCARAYELACNVILICFIYSSALIYWRIHSICVAVVVFFLCVLCDGRKWGNDSWHSSGQKAIFFSHWKVQVEWGFFVRLRLTLILPLLFWHCMVAFQPGYRHKLLHLIVTMSALHQAAVLIQWS